jgi:hypothetical protein
MQHPSPDVDPPVSMASHVSPSCTRGILGRENSAAIGDDAAKHAPLGSSDNYLRFRSFV